MSTLVMLLVCVVILFIGVWVAWFRPDSLRRTLRSVYSDPSLARMATSDIAFWVARAIISAFFLIALGLLLLYFVDI